MLKPQAMLMIKKIFSILLLISSLITVAGCANINKRPTSIMVAQYTTEPIKLDGLLNEPVWQAAIVYHLALAQDQLNRGRQLAEAGEVRLAWDNKNIYLAIKFYDSDIKARGTKDQLHHYRLGDTAELFLKPESQSWYWELYATPNNKKSSFWLRRCKRGLMIKNPGLKVAAQSTGTLNKSTDKDSYWTAEMAMPLKALSLAGRPFNPQSKYRILVARYNYRRYSRRPECSMTPQLSKTDYHRHQEYAILKFLK